MVTNGDGYDTFDTPYGPVTLPRAQSDGVAACIDLLVARGEQPRWHRNACGCCVAVHGADPSRGGYVVGSDGTFDWYDACP